MNSEGTSKNLREVDNLQVVPLPGIHQVPPLFILRNIFLREPSWGALRRRGYGLWYTMIILPQTPCQYKKVQIPHGSSSTLLFE